MEDEVVAESVHGGGGGEATIREIKDGAEGVEQAGGGGVEEVCEQVASLPEDRAKDFRDGEDEFRPERTPRAHGRRAWMR
jgi:hypothetical protein